MALDRRLSPASRNGARNKTRDRLAVDEIDTVQQTKPGRQASNRGEGRFLPGSWIMHAKRNWVQRM
ncbi:hypothetical protein N7452_007949 [Penicillium brevicompactum]|uniref:Uncharacterized protein n=1 Tax=Penicillium brevicompactum TaxID=5074 RepID=A0A9W9UEH2_PENBR|nr:hypothetical protein N7452_007949 [Penicillium brevicompactum]